MDDSLHLLSQEANEPKNQSSLTSLSDDHAIGMRLDSLELLESSEIPLNNP